MQAAQILQEHEVDTMVALDMTHVEISGGCPGRRYQGSDQIVVRSWNGDGVCTEKVLVFDPTDGSW